MKNLAFNYTEVGKSGFPVVSTWHSLLLYYYVFIYLFIIVL